jgi:catalase
MCDILADKRATAEIRRVWIGYWSQADAGLGQRLAQKLQAAGAM